MHGPFDQFAPTFFFGALSDAFVTSVVAASLIACCALLPLRTVPGYLQASIEMFYEVIIDQLGDKAQCYAGLVMSLSGYILALNLIGMCPSAFPVTSHLSVTLGLAMIVFFVAFFGGLLLNTRHFLEHFFIPGIPIFISPLLVIIEVVSYLLRPITLGIRLAMAVVIGHVLLDVLAMLGQSAGSCGFIFSLPCMVLMNVMEMLVCIVQSAVFTVLTCSYLKESRE